MRCSRPQRDTEIRHEGRVPGFEAPFGDLPDPGHVLHPYEPDRDGLGIVVHAEHSSERRRRRRCRRRRAQRSDGLCARLVAAEIHASARRWIVDHLSRVRGSVEVRIRVPVPVAHPGAMTSTREHVIFGPGAAGLATLDALLRRGERVRLVNRAGRAPVPAGVEVVGGDARDREFTTAVTRGARVVYQVLNAPYHRWAAEFPALQAGVLAGAEAAGARLVSLENVYLYGHPDGQPQIGRAHV